VTPLRTVLKGDGGARLPPGADLDLQDLLLRVRRAVRVHALPRDLDALGSARVELLQRAQERALDGLRLLRAARRAAAHAGHATRHPGHPAAHAGHATGHASHSRHDAHPEGHAAAAAHEDAGAATATAAHAVLLIAAAEPAGKASERVGAAEELRGGGKAVVAVRRREA
jgi:hypothetical protein